MKETVVRIIFLSFIAIILSVSQSLALTCERYRLDTSGFSTKSAAESYYPKNLSIDDNRFKPKGGSSKQMRYEEVSTENSTGLSHRIIFSLLPNGKMIAALQGRAGYKAPGQAKYKCDLNAVELKESISNKPKTDSTTPKANTSDTNNGSASDTTENDGLSLSEAKRECSSIGYKPATEKYADCVMKLTK